MKIFKISVLALLLGVSAFAQVPGELEDVKIPTDPDLKIDSLENGLTYYIKNNPKTEGKAELRLVINAGSVLETESQQGLAHFLEHMAFNGTKNFEKNELINYLQNLGVEFGADLNAHTSFEETVYKLSLPTDDETFDTGLMILRDWADGIELSDEEIDKERGVVAEELRGGLGVGKRMFNAFFPVITNNSRQSQRLPIGKMDIIMNSDYEEIRSFYKDWYRPELMAVIVVGDVDIEETEQKIIDFFQSMESPENAKERKEYGLPERKESEVLILTDKEQADVNLQTYFITDREKPEDLEDYRDLLVKRLYTGILYERFQRKLESGEAPYIGAGVGIGTLLADKSSYYTGGTLKEDKIEEGIQSILEENERAKRMGFGEGELERYKARLLNSAALAMKEDGKRNSRYYVEQYINHYMDKEPIPGNTFIYDFYKEHLPTIELEEVNRVAEPFNTNPFVMVVRAPEKEGLDLPSEEKLLEMVENISEVEIEPYVDEFSDAELMASKPEPGKIVSTDYIEEVDVTKIKLSNGVTVLLKPTTLQNDIINMRGFRPGGSSLAPDSLYISARSASQLVYESGVNGFTTSDLRNINAGKTASVKPYINFYEELFSGTSSNEDLETMLQMTHLFFTAPNKDEGIFEAYKNRLIATAKNSDVNASRYFYNEIAKVISQDHLRGTRISAEQYEEGFHLDTAIDFYQERFSGADGFTFIFVGNFDVEEVKPLLETYLGSLPTTGVESDWRDIGLRRPNGVINKEYYRAEEDKAEVVIHYNGELDFSLEKKQLIGALGKLLKLKLYEEMREELGDVYGVRVQGWASDAPTGYYRVTIEFSTDPEDVEKLFEIIEEEIREIKEEGVSEEDATKIREALRLNAEEGLDYNSYWTGKLKDAVEYNLDPAEIPNYEKGIKKITAEALQEAAKEYINPENVAQFTLYPKKD